MPVKPYSKSSPTVIYDRYQRPIWNRQSRWLYLLHSFARVTLRCGTIPATFSPTRIDHAHERPTHTETCAQEA
ncbi:hypothetical protein AWU82_29150 [Pseudomonas glycinae]|uniref:Uncharacterized protein n=1 Tax=Pseudomonas glycinae TaxID=1785145 RepID=A0ABN5FWD4_9PSED|nr:hypothetical protein AWU82_28835 [Pseudomonas glycinae]AUG97514.1 hypothetical protein AWU82_29150 [Pseudomonas glycinae]